MTNTEIRDLISRPGGYRLSDGVYATEEGLDIKNDILSEFVGILSTDTGVMNRHAWPDAAERLRYRDGEPWCIASGTIIACFASDVPVIYLDELPLHRLAAILCDDATCFRVLHYCIMNYENF